MALSGHRLLQSLIRRPADRSGLEDGGEIIGGAPGNRTLDERHQTAAMHETHPLVAIEAHPKLVFDLADARLQPQRSQQAGPLTRRDGDDHQTPAIESFKVTTESPIEVVAHAFPVLAASLHFTDLPEMAQAGDGEIGQRNANLSSPAILPACPFSSQQRKSCVGARE